VLEGRFRRSRRGGSWGGGLVAGDNEGIGLSLHLGRGGGLED